MKIRRFLHELAPYGSLLSFCCGIWCVFAGGQFLRFAVLWYVGAAVLFVLSVVLFRFLTYPRIRKALAVGWSRAKQAAGKLIRQIRNKFTRNADGVRRIYGNDRRSFQFGREGREVSLRRLRMPDSYGSRRDNRERVRYLFGAHILSLVRRKKYTIRGKTPHEMSRGATEQEQLLYRAYADARYTPPACMPEDELVRQLEKQFLK